MLNVFQYPERVAALRAEMPKQVRHDIFLVFVGAQDK